MVQEQYSEQSGIARKRACTDSELAGQRWRTDSGLDEHRLLFERAVLELGLPRSLLQDFDLAVFTRKSVPARAVPAPWTRVDSVLHVQRSISEFAQLPDFAYSLFDWSTGLLTCPADPTLKDALKCHSYTGHLGALNSTHFLPQAERAYSHYHDLALNRAEVCAGARASLTGQSRFADYADACQIEALILEAIAQHYLTDAWSVGHMWERWGSPQLTDFAGSNTREKLGTALVVAAVTGIIHGVEPLLSIPDPMCTPDDRITYRVGEDEQLGAGDDHWKAVSSEPRYQPQWQKMMQCSRDSLEQVYRATMGQSSLPANLDCFSQRVNNTALYVGITTPTKLPAWVVEGPLTAYLGAPPIAHAFASLRSELRMAADQRPRETDMATGERLGTFLDAGVNSKAADKLAPFWDLDSHLSKLDSEADELDPEAAIPRLFHRAHATEWCGKLTKSDLYALRARALTKAAQAPAEAKTSAEAQLCAEMVRRHLNVYVDGATSATPDTCSASDDPSPTLPPTEDQAPLCTLLVPQAVRLDYRVGADLASATSEEHAMRWCTRPDCEVCEPACGYRATTLGCSGDPSTCVAFCKTFENIARQQGMCLNEALAVERCHYSPAGLAVGCSATDPQIDAAACASQAAALKACKVLRDQPNPMNNDGGVPVMGDTPEAYCTSSCNYKLTSLGCAGELNTCIPLCQAGLVAEAQSRTCVSEHVTLERCRYSQAALRLGCTAGQAKVDELACAAEKAALTACGK